MARCLKNTPGSSERCLSPPRKRAKKIVLCTGQKEMLINIYKVSFAKNPTFSKTEHAEFAAECSGVSLATVYRVLDSYKENNQFSSKKKISRVRTVLDCVDEDTKGRIRRVVHEFFFQNELPTIAKILKKVNQDQSLPNFKISTFRKLLLELKFRLVAELDSQKNSLSYDPMAILRGQNAEEDTTEENTLTSTVPPLEDPNSNTRQTILLSATLTKGIAELADFTMKDHIYIDALDESSTMNPEHLIIPNTVKQEFMLTFIKHRLVMLSALLISKSKRNGKTFVFMATSHMVDFHYDLFKEYLLKMPKNKGKLKAGNVLLLDDVELDDSDDEEDVLNIELFKLHGSMNQNERKEVFSGFRKAKKGVLLCTDVAARGIDVPEAESIIQYTGPQTIDDYIHRVGRTGRAGKSGSALIFLAHEEQEFISRLQEHKVFLQEHKTDDLLKNFTLFMEEPDSEKATLALQRRFESAISKDKELYQKACFAYSSWSRFYSSFPNKMKSIFDLKKVNLGHFVTSFGLQDTPTAVAKIVRGQVSKNEPKRLNRKLDNHEVNKDIRKPSQKRPIRSLSLTTSEFSSGLEPVKKKKKKHLES